MSTGTITATAPYFEEHTRKTECGADLFPDPLAPSAAPFALLRNTRKTECGADWFLIPLAVCAAPFALPRRLPL